MNLDFPWQIIALSPSLEPDAEEAGFSENRKVLFMLATNEVNQDLLFSLRHNFEFFDLHECEKFKWIPFYDKQVMLSSN